MLRARRQWLRAACGLLLCVKIAGASAAAHAHASPQVRAVLFGGDALGRVLISNRGLLFGGVAGTRWKLMCNEALGVTTSELPEIVSLPDGGMLAATSRGLKASKDGGCSWQSVEPFATTAAPSIAQHPTRAETLYATAYGKGACGVYASQDAGAHWRRVLAAEDDAYLRYLRIAPGRPEQLYMRKLGLDGMRFVYSVWSSSDAGESWAGHPVEVNADETDLVLLSVSPVDPQLVIAKAEAANPGAVAERLLVSRDGGQRFESGWSARAISAAEWSRDGANLWIASDEGLFRSSDGARTFERVGPAELVSCLKQTEQGLLLCGYYRGGSAGMDGVGMSADGGQTTEPFMLMTEVTEPIACEDSAPTMSTCAPFWADWKREVIDGALPLPPSAAGASAALAGAGGSVAPSAGTGGAPGVDGAPGASGGCSVGLTPRSPGSAWLLCAIALLSRMRKRRRPRGLPAH